MRTFRRVLVAVLLALAIGSQAAPPASAGPLDGKVAIVTGAGRGIG